MNENQRDTEHRPDEGKQVQQELERQLREFGDTMSDAFRHGFEGRGEEIGDRAWDVGRAAVDAANYGINAAGRAVREGQRQAEKAARAAGGSGSAWARQFFARKPEPTPVESIRISAKKRYSAGCTLLAVGITFMVIFGLGTLGCLIGLGIISPAALGDVVVSATEDGSVLMTGTNTFMNTAYNALGIVGSVLALVTAGFGWMTAAGASRMRAGKKLNLYADMAEEFDYQKGLSLEMLADLTHQKKQKALKALRGYIHRGWLPAWLDEKDEKLYLTAEDYRAAQEARKAAEQAPRPEPQPEEAESTVPLNLEVARSFAQVLKKEKALMQDERAVEELDHMQKTTRAICDWLEAHPESLPKARRFAEYYIPTTLKLLHTYNDVQGQQGENAEAIRRDIAGILHTLNQAYDNLYDKLLSDVALDVSSEIAALQGMLANDGLTGEGML